MGFIAYNLSFSIVPIVYTATALIFGPQSLIMSISTAFSYLAAGYLHTFASRTGMAASVAVYHGFYIAQAKMRARRQHGEELRQSLVRFFCNGFGNALVLNLMWESFTIFYLIHTFFMSEILENSTSDNVFECRLTLLHGVTRYLAGCLSGISTGMINHLWQRRQKLANVYYAIFGRNESELNVKWNQRRTLLSPRNVENWIKVISMLGGAVFFLSCNIPNPTNFHLIPLHWKKFFSDLLVINFGWLFLRDAAMLIFTQGQEPRQNPLILNEVTNENHNTMQLLNSNAHDDPNKLLNNNVDV
jgi:hypothetical protein